jgi:hypothetical protein
VQNQSLIPVRTLFLSQWNNSFLFTSPGMRSPSLAEHGQRPRPGARILGPSSRTPGPFIVSNSTKTTSGGFERLSLACRVLFGLCLTYFIISIIFGWSTSYWNGAEQRQQSVQQNGVPGSMATAGPHEGLLGPALAVDTQKRGEGNHGGRVLTRQDQFLRKPRSTDVDYGTRHKVKPLC